MTTRIPALDGLRAISIAFVVYAHLGIAGYLPKALSASSLALDGVLIFFVVSGYLITAQLLHEKRQTGTVYLASFWLRRAFRLLPAAFVFIGAVAILGCFGYFRAERAAFLHAVTYTMDYYRPSGSSLQHLWSLSVEEQFYFLWPLAILLTAARASVAICFSVMLVCPCLRLWGWYLGGVDQALIFRRFDMVADALAVGCLLCLAGDKLPKWTRSTAVALASFAAILAFGVVASRIPVLAIAQVTLDSLCAAAIVHALNVRDLWISRTLSWPPLAWLGAISYSLYLWQALFTAPGFNLAYTLPALVACSAASYYFLEKPIRQWAKKKWSA